MCSSDLWGQGLGIITQSSLLRVFDPMEMYGVQDTLQQSSQEHRETDEFRETTRLAVSEPGSSPAIAMPEPGQSLGPVDLTRRLNNLSFRLRQLQLPSPEQEEIRSLAAELDIICQQLDKKN